MNKDDIVYLVKEFPGFEQHTPINGGMWITSVFLITEAEYLKSKHNKDFNKAVDELLK